MPNKIFEGSALISVVKGMPKACRAAEKWFDDAYRHSMVCGIGRSLMRAVSHYPGSDFVGKLARADDGSYSTPFANSVLVYMFGRMFRRCGESIRSWAGDSGIFIETKNIFGYPGTALLKRVSLSILTALIVNVALSVVLAKKIDVVGWAFRIGLLFAGLAGFFCEAGWESVKSGSKVITIWKKIRSRLSE